VQIALFFFLEARVNDAELSVVRVDRAKVDLDERHDLAVLTRDNVLRESRY
jgi:hypothetical protein